MVLATTTARGEQDYYSANGMLPRCKGDLPSATSRERQLEDGLLHGHDRNPVAVIDEMGEHSLDAFLRHLLLPLMTFSSMVPHPGFDRSHLGIGTIRYIGSQPQCRMLASLKPTLKSNWPQRPE
jgi:hypothetical protein